MSDFKKLLEVDIDAVFLDDDIFADEHKPYSFKGETVSEIDLSGVEELTSIDVSKAENEVLKTGVYSVNMKNFFAYSCALAARASGKPMEFFTGLPLHEAVKVRGTVNAASFFE